MQYVYLTYIWHFCWEISFYNNTMTHYYTKQSYKYNAILLANDDEPIQYSFTDSWQFYNSSSYIGSKKLNIF